MRVVLCLSSESKLKASSKQAVKRKVGKINGLKTSVTLINICPSYCRGIAKIVQ